MCGICGIIDFKSRIEQNQLFEMIKVIAHRGPNNLDAKIIPSKICSVGMAHARLSIIDLSTNANQPMYYKQFSIVFNGEIYNYKQISLELQKLGHTFLTSSDTEVILHAFEQWGNDCVDRFIGMFAFVIYDNVKELVTLFRDRAGVKPLYYYWADGLFLFSSELKSFHKHPRFKKEMSNESTMLYFRYGYIPAPFTIFKNCFQLESGHCLTIDLAKCSLDFKKYWDLTDFYQKPQLEIGYNEAVNAVEKLLISACNYRMVADVPVGVFLSGGFDSTGVTAILQKDRTEKIKTFTIGFEEGNNEAHFAKETARYLGTDHTEYYCTSAEAKEIIPTLPFFFDEPFADSSAIPTILVSRLARRDVTVALSADAGDEIFGGYNTYRSLNRNNSLLNSIPGFGQAPLSVLLASLSKLPFGQHRLLKHQMATLSSVLRTENQYRVSHLFDEMQSYPKHGMSKLLIARSKSSYSNLLSRELFNDDISVAMAVDYRSYLQNDILTKVDRATMSVSLEGREPLLDHRLVEFAARLPIEFKYDGKITKKILKDIVYRYIPKEMMDRPKSGFSLPVYSWLRGDLKPFLNEMLSEDMIKKSGIFNYQYVEQLKQNFLNGESNEQIMIWRLLQFQMWFNMWM